MCTPPEPERARFPRALRVLRRSDFVATRRVRGVRGRYLLLRVHRRPEGDGPPRLGLAVGRVTGNAPTRNRIKRRVREVFRLHRSAFPAGFDYIVSAVSREAATCPFPALRDELLQLVARSQRRGKGPRRGKP